MTDTDTMEAARRLLDYIGSPRVKLTFASDAEIVARALIALGEENARLKALLVHQAPTLQRMGEVMLEYAKDSSHG